MDAARCAAVYRCRLGRGADTRASRWAQAMRLGDYRRQRDRVNRPEATVGGAGNRYDPRS
ncbi:hypothetical protein LC55x_4171 [Lysobacter capsici]|nr:hypothetical protein LC55x_4171 [Lysobacter capsici]